MVEIVWISLLGLTGTYAVSMLFGELVGLVLWRRIDRMERKIHAVSFDEYSVKSAIPMAALVVSLVGSHFLSRAQGNSPQALMSYLMLAALLLAFGHFLHQVTTAAPKARTVGRARWRRHNAEVRSRLESGEPLSFEEHTSIRGRLNRLFVVGARVASYAESMTWQQAFRSESAARKVVTVAAVFMPVALAGWAVGANGLHPGSMHAAGLLLALSVLAVAGPLVRLARRRREVRSLGEEIRDQSKRLIEQVDAAKPERPSVLARARFFWRRATGQSHRPRV